MNRGALSAGAALLALSAAGCTRMVFKSSREASAQIEAARGAFEPVRFSSADGTRLSGMFFPAARAAAAGTVVHFHGNTRNMTAHFPYSRWLAAEGFNVLVFDYRGFGDSEGVSTLAGAVADGAAAIAYARSRPDTDPSRIFVLGQSLGGALALAALARPGAPPVRAAAIEGSFSSFKEIARVKMAKRPLWWAFQWPLSRLLFSTRYDPVKSVKKLDGIPLAVIHGDKDPIVPESQARDLYAAARGPKEFWAVAEGGHLHAFTRFGTTYRPRLAAFFSRAPEPRSGNAP